MKSKKFEETVEVVDKALKILEILAVHTTPLSLTQLAVELKHDRNKTLRILMSLCDKGFIEYDSNIGMYQLSINSITFAQKLVYNSNITSFARNSMVELVNKHCEAVYITVTKNNGVLFLDMVDCEQPVKAAFMVGKRLPFFTNAAGKILKSLDSRDLLEKTLKQESRNSKIPDLEELESELADIRAKGVAVDNGGVAEGTISVAVGVKDYVGKVVGAITMLVPSPRMIAERLEKEIIPSMLQEAEMVSQKFGYLRA